MHHKEKWSAIFLIRNSSSDRRLAFLIWHISIWVQYTYGAIDSFFFNLGRTKKKYIQKEYSKPLGKKLCILVSIIWPKDYFQCITFTCVSITDAHARNDQQEVTDRLWTSLRVTIDVITELTWSCSSSSSLEYCLVWRLASWLSGILPFVR